jgi:hypothetical protein
MEDREQSGCLTVNVPVAFSGVVQVMLPPTTVELLYLAPDDFPWMLAKNFALAKVLAVVDNEDSPDEEAISDVMSECSMDEDYVCEAWDELVACVSGCWTLREDGEKPVDEVILPVLPSLADKSQSTLAWFQIQKLLTDLLREPLMPMTQEILSDGGRIEDYEFLVDAQTKRLLDLCVERKDITHIFGFEIRQDPEGRNCVLRKKNTV